MDWILSAAFLLALVVILLATAGLADPEFALRMRAAWTAARSRAGGTGAVTVARPSPVRRNSGRHARHPGPAMGREAGAPSGASSAARR